MSVSPEALAQARSEIGRRAALKRWARIGKRARRLISKTLHEAKRNKKARNE